MPRFLFLLITFQFLLVMGSSCKSKIDTLERACYYWKNSSYSLNDYDLQFLRNLQIQKLYVKFFEVDADSIMGPVPIAKSELHLWDFNHAYGKDTLYTKLMDQLEVVPCIFIKNKILYHHTPGSLDSLADNILFLTDKYFNKQIKNNNWGYREIQIDCDWTDKTSSNYFYLLRQLKKLSHKTISCTLRLYPYKYKDKTGIPPVDKAVLMCYNLTSPFADEDNNSILSAEELKKYLVGSGKYPLHLDIALPVFTNAQLYQNNQFTSFISLNKQEVKENLKSVKPLWYEVVHDIETNERLIRTGDLIKIEEISPQTLKSCVSLLKQNLKLDSNETILLFHLDQNISQHYSNETIDSLYSDFMQ